MRNYILQILSDGKFCVVNTQGDQISGKNSSWTLEQAKEIQDMLEVAHNKGYRQAKVDLRNFLGIE